MLYADEIVLFGTRREEVENKQEEWRMATYGIQGAEDQLKENCMPDVQWRWELGCNMGYWAVKKAQEKK